MLVRALTLYLPIRVGNPKYFSYLWVEDTPTKDSMKTLASAFVFFLKKISFFPIKLFPRDFLIQLKNLNEKPLKDTCFTKKQVFINKEQVV
jgi:hypothetical protein